MQISKSYNAHPISWQLFYITDAPVILTLPHMLGASNEYRKMIRGLNPDAKKHQTFVDVQTVSGSLNSWSCLLKFIINYIIAY